MDLELVEKIKRLTIRALVSDEIFMGILVLKGGNALNIAYDISSRGSIDIDFSMEKDFTEREKKGMTRKAKHLLNDEFSNHGLSVFDVEFVEKPKKINSEVKDFWGGYSLSFKIVKSDTFVILSDDIEKLRRNAIPIGKNNSTKFTVDISKYEFIGKKRPVDIEGATVFVYSPEMIALEKLRALCQQIPDYKIIIKYMTEKSRARDFYDIHNILTYFSIDFESKENIELAEEIFSAKKVPLNFISKLEKQRELHQGTWTSVVQTISQDEDLFEFDYYFNFVTETFRFLANT